MNGDRLPPDPPPEQGEKTEAGATPRRKPVRRRGGQNGNQNARKHGFYSGDLDPAEICEFWRIITSEGLAPEMALLRIKLRSSLQQDPGNLRVLSDASRLLSRWYSSKSRLNNRQSVHLKMVIRTILMLISHKTNRSYFNNLMTAPAKGLHSKRGFSPGKKQARHRTNQIGLRPPYSVSPARGERNLISRLLPYLPLVWR
jgi:hypothetical protein